MKTKNNNHFLQCFVLALLLLCNGRPADAQQRAFFGYLPGSNDFSFPERTLDSIMPGPQYKAFFYGETHTRFFEPMYKLHYIVYLHQRYGIRDVFMETGYSAAVLFNQYLLTGDTSVIGIRVLYTSPAYMEMWRQLYAYNSSLPDDRKLRIHGVDFEATSAVFRALLLLRQNIQTPESLANIFHNIAQYAADTAIRYDERFFNKLSEVRDVFKKEKDAVAAVYGNKLLRVHDILYNDLKMTDEDRDKKIYDHMQREIGSLSIEKFVACYGGDHVNYEYPGSVASRYRKSPAYAHRVSTIRMFCFDAYDNWSHEVVPCIGTYDEQEGRILKKRYMQVQYRAVMIPDKTLNDKILNHSANYYLFAEDSSK